MTKPFMIIILFLFSLQAFSQWRETGDSYNRLGFQGGLTYSTMLSDEFNFKPGIGYTGGLTTRANTFGQVIVIYGVNFFQFNTSLQVLDPSSQAVEIDFKATGVQLNLFMGYKLIGEHLSIEGGPVIQFNGKWSPEEGKEDYRLQQYNILASDIEDVSKFNLNIAAGLSTGVAGVKVWVQYQYGLTNMYRDLDFAALKDKDSRITPLKGNLGMAMAGMVIYL